ncbi:hypothetical protein Slin15195_G060660 [Septoria linicola]|uniref:Uncharacterized protein n=1 Tax=Septoria linicola TaxID=215465 RepID=A0A9Q9ANI8_9PEZI|nr:hypothetical protein Slin15195_G060660 [Septoria linicola]
MRYSITIVTLALLAANVSIAAPIKRGTLPIDNLDETIGGIVDSAAGAVGMVGGTLAQTAGAVESVAVNGAGTVFAGLSGGGVGGTVAQTAGAVESTLTNVLGTVFAGLAGFLRE